MEDFLCMIPLLRWQVCILLQGMMTLGPGTDSESWYWQPGIWMQVVYLEDGLPGLVGSKLGGGFKDFSSSPLPGEMMEFD